MVTTTPGDGLTLTPVAFLQLKPPTHTPPFAICPGRETDMGAEGIFLSRANSTAGKTIMERGLNPLRDSLVAIQIRELLFFKI